MKYINCGELILNSQAENFEVYDLVIYYGLCAEAEAKNGLNYEYFIKMAPAENPYARFKRLSRFRDTLAHLRERGEIRNPIPVMGDLTIWKERDKVAMAIYLQLPKLPITVTTKHQKTETFDKNWLRANFCREEIDEIEFFRAEFETKTRALAETNARA